MNYYFEDKNSEICYNKYYFIDIMTDNKTNSMQVYKAKRITGQHIYYCKVFGEAGETGEACGTDCCEYVLRNGKSGRCKHSSYCYEPTKQIILLINGKEQEQK